MYYLYNPILQKIPVAVVKSSDTGLKIIFVLLRSHSRPHSTRGGQSTAVRQSFCPVCVHSPTAEICVEQVFPDQRHRRALLSRNSPPAWWIVVCIIFPFTQIVNRFIEKSSKKFSAGWDRQTRPIRYNWLTLRPGCCILNLFS